MITYKINGIEYRKLPNYIEKYGFMTPVTAENFTIEEVEVEPPAVTALKSILQDEITVLNAKYTGLELLITDSPAQAIPKLLAVLAEISDCNRIDLLYRYILEAGK